MNKAELKRERRAIRHQLQAAVLDHGLSLELRLQSTERQLRSYACKIADQLLAGRNPAIVETIT